MQGRFTSVDPLHSSAIPTDPQSWNRYSYVGNRPLIYTDPTGLQWGRNKETGEYQWFGNGGGTVPDGWEKVSIGTEYGSVNGQVVLQADGKWDYVRPPQAGICALCDSEIGNSIAKTVGYPWMIGVGVLLGGPQGGLAVAASIHDNETQGPLILGAEEQGRHGSFREAKRAAGILMSQHPDSVSTVPMLDRNGAPVLGGDGKPIMTREYTFTRADGSKVIIQDHSAGHNFGRPDGRGNQGAHFNVRPEGNTRTGAVPGTKRHYPFRPR